MRVKEKREIERISLGLSGGALSADVIILRMSRRVGARVVSIRSTLEMSISIVRCLGTLFLLIAANSPIVIGRQGSTADLENLKRQAHESIVNGQLSAAIESYEKAIELAPKDVGLRVDLGAILTKAGRPADSIALYQKALRMAPHELRAEMGLAKAYRSIPNYAEAKSTLERAAREHPKSAAPLAEMGDLEIQLQTYDSAIGHLKAALALGPANIETRNLLAAAYKAKGDVESALAELQKVLARDSDNALAHFLRAEIFSDRNQDQLALADSQKVVELQPQNARGRVLLGKILLRTPEGLAATEISKRCGEAVSALEPVATVQAGDSQTIFLLSRAYRCAGEAEKADKAAAEFESASQKERSTKENEAQAMHLVQQADEAALKNDFVGALGLLQQALAKDPNSGAAYSMTAKLYYSAGDLGKASDAIGMALERGPHQPDFLYVQGKILEKQGKTDEALASFEQTTLINPKESDAYFEMGVIYQARNDRARAAAAYKRAVELAPDDADYRRALASVSDAAPTSRRAK
jgi:tetratricopeptide (TPR) repeat protein